eukprot:4620115-Prymnesium_polylepis.1
MKALDDPSAIIRKASAEAVGKVSPGTIALHGEALVKRFQDSDIDVRITLVQSVGMMDVEALKLLGPELVGIILDDRSEQVRNVIGKQLDKLDTTVHVSLAATYIHDLPRRNRAANAAEVLAKLRPAALAHYLPELVDVFHVHDPKVKDVASKLLVR